MIDIKVKVTATQKSNSVDIKDVDGYATLHDLKTMRRLVYQEGCGAYTTLDFSKDQVLLKRENEWVTLAEFELNAKNIARIISVEGELRFDIQVVELEVLDTSIKIVYNLLQGEELIDVHTFKCVWTKEEEAWLEIH